MIVPLLLVTCPFSAPVAPLAELGMEQLVHRVPLEYTVQCSDLFGGCTTFSDLTLVSWPAFPVELGELRAITLGVQNFTEGTLAIENPQPVEASGDIAISGSAMFYFPTQAGYFSQVATADYMSCPYTATMFDGVLDFAGPSAASCSTIEVSSASSRRFEPGDGLDFRAYSVLPNETEGRVFGLLSSGVSGGYTGGPMFAGGVKASNYAVGYVIYEFERR